MSEILRSVDAEIDRRSARGKRLAGQFTKLPKGMNWNQFLVHPYIADLDLDFITACEMFDAYEVQQ